MYPQLLSVFWTDLHEQLWLQLSQPGQPATHTAAEVMLGETIGREDMWILLRPYCCQHLLGLPDFRQGVRLLLVDEILHRRFIWLVVRWQRPIGESGRRKEPGFTVALHDEGCGTVVEVQPHAVGLGRCVGFFR